MIFSAGCPVTRFVPKFIRNGLLTKMTLYSFGATAKKQATGKEEPKYNHRSQHYNPIPHGKLELLPGVLFWLRLHLCKKQVVRNEILYVIKNHRY